MSTINRLSSVDALQSGDLMPIWDSSNGDTRKASMTTLLAYIQASFADPDYTTRIVAPAASGWNVDVGDTGTSTFLIINPVADYALGSVSLPPATSTANGQEITVLCTKNVAAFSATSSGATVTGLPLNLAAYSAFKLRYSTSQLTWHTLSGGVSLASLASYTPAGTGAVPTDVQTLLREIIISPTGFGFSSVGEEIQSALNSMTTGGILTLPNFVFTLSEKITIPYSNTTIRGRGRGSILRADAATFDLIEVASGANYCTIEDVHFQGAASAEGTSVFGVITEDVSPQAFHLTVKRCTFGGSSATARLTNGVKLNDNSHNCKVQDCHFDELMGNSAGYGYGLLTGAVYNAEFSGNLGSASSGKGRHMCYFSTGAIRCKATNNLASNWDFAAFTTNSLSAQAANDTIVFSDNIIVGGGIESTAGAIMFSGWNVNCIVEDNIIIDTGFIGIGAQSADGNDVETPLTNLSIANNKIIRPGTSGIDVWGTTNTVIRGNDIVDASNDADDTSPSIRVQASTSSSPVACISPFITGNTSKTTAGANRPRAALTISQSLPVPTGVQLDGNSFEAGARWTVELTTPTTADLGGKRETFLFTQSAVTASQSAADLTGTRWVAPRPGYVVGISFRLNSSWTGGEITLQAWKNSSLSGAAGNVLSATAGFYGAATTDWKAVATQLPTEGNIFAAMDEVWLKVTTNAGWTPTTAVLTAVVEVEYI